jgi:hypothetical protein
MTKNIEAELHYENGNWETIENGSWWKTDGFKTFEEAIKEIANDRDATAHFIKAGE